MHIVVESSIDAIRQALVIAPTRLQKFIDDADPWAARKFKQWASDRSNEVRCDPTKSADDVHDAAELTRRAERALACAVEAAQESGKVRSATGPKRPDLPSPKEFFANEREDVNSRNMARVDDDQFELILKEMRAAGTMSSARAATLSSEASGRVIKRINRPTSSARSIPEIIGVLAGEGQTSRQIAAEVGMSADHVRRLAKRAGIAIPADKIARGRKIDPVRVIRETVDALSGLEFGINLIAPDDYQVITEEQARELLAALEGPMKAISNLRKELKSR